MRPLYFLFLLLFLFACKEKVKSPAPEISFYYWKTQISKNDLCLSSLKNLHCKKLYLRLFDVDLKEDSIVPVGIVDGIENIPDSFEIIPVVFIRNRIFKKAEAPQLDLLAGRLYNKTKALLTNKKINSFQFDCDWSASTKEKFFYLINQFNELISKKFHISSTIRLHQVKYRLKTGVPPVKEGVLMFYNMGRMEDMDTLNSILNLSDAKKYCEYLNTYPLPLRLALPIYSWQIHYRNGKVIDLISKENRITIHPGKFEKTEDENRFKVVHSFLERGIYFEEGDEIKTENVTQKNLEEATTYLKEKYSSFHEIIFYDLDSINLREHHEKDLQKIIDALR